MGYEYNAFIALPAAVALMIGILLLVRDIFRHTKSSSDD